MSKLSDKKLNPIQESRAPRSVTSPTEGTFDALVSAGQVPRDITVQTKTRLTNGNQATMWFNNVDEQWHLKIDSPEGQFIEEYVGESRESLMFGLLDDRDEQERQAIKAVDPTYDLDNVEYALHTWRTSPTLEGGRWFFDMISRLNQTDADVCCAILRKWVMHWYGSLNRPYAYNETVKWILDGGSDELEVYIQHSKNLKNQAEQDVLAAQNRANIGVKNPHQNLRRVEKTDAEKYLDNKNKAKDIKQLRHEAIPALNSSQESRRERLVETVPSGTSRKL